jgi:hypothetical protein
MDPLDQRAHGLSLADCAEIMSMMSLLRTEHGEPGYHEPFQQFLRSRGTTENGWATAYNHWYQQMQADPALAAKFHTFMSQYHARQITAQQPDVSGDALEGLSLEAYAKISARSQTGAAIEGLVAAEGLTMDQWQRGQAAWTAKMSSCSPSDPILMQYGQLYQQWAPNHQASMEAATEAHLADAARREGRADGMSAELTLDNAATFFDHDDVRVRARGVREMIRIWELQEDARDAHMHALTQRAFDAAIAILHYGAGEEQPGYFALSEDVNAMDIHAWSAMHEQEETHQGTPDLVHGALKDLAGEGFLTAEQNETAKQAVAYAIERMTPRDDYVRQVFEITTDPMKRTSLRSLMDDYTSTLEDLAETLEDWDYTGPDEEDSAADVPPPVSAQPAHQPPAPADDPQADLLALLKSLPVLGDLLRMLGL